MGDKVVEKEIHEFNNYKDKYVMISKLKTKCGKESNMRIEQTKDELKVNWSLIGKEK